MSRKQQLGVAGGVVGAVAATAAAALAVERILIGRTARGGDPHAAEPFGALVPDRAMSVVADDGVVLQLEEDGQPDAPLTVVFVHGYTLASGSFHFQRRALREELGDRIRIVLYDQRSHGNSQRSDPARATVSQLAHDLATVLDGAAPTGPVMLVGHSMGGMTIMQLAADRPELFGDRVVAAVLIATSLGGLPPAPLGLPSPLGRAAGAVAPIMLRGARRMPALVERGRRLGADLSWMFTRRMSFADPSVSHAVADYLAAMIAATPVDVVADFYPSLMAHDGTAAIPALSRVRLAVITGDADRMIPPAHSSLIADSIPSAQLHVIPAAGHVVVLERPEEVNGILVEFVRELLAERATGRRSAR
jgi:pimeloyl-ACP methyl ester carboxylesterase